MKRSKKASARGGFAVAVTMLLLVCLACMSGSSRTCTGELVVSGKKYNGIDDNEAEAKRNSCSKYCIEGDPEMDAMYRIWLDALPEERRKRVRKGPQGKWDAVFDSDSIKRYVEKCEKRCLSSRDISVSCKG